MSEQRAETAALGLPRFAWHYSRIVATRSDGEVTDPWMERTEELLRAVVVGGPQPIAEWEVCLRILNAVEGFLSELGRSGIRLDQDFPEGRYQEVRYIVGAYLHADDIAVLRPYERLNAVRWIENDPRPSDD